MQLRHSVVTALWLTVISFAAQAGIVNEEFEYDLGGETFSGYIAYDDAIAGPRAGVLVIHEWWGLNAYARQRANMLAAEGYTAMAIDMYGKGKVAEHPDDAQKFMGAIIGNLPEAERRFDVAKGLLQQHQTVAGEKVAAIGYCFGGGMVLHMARAGKELAGVVSFHGSLGAKSPVQPGAIKTRIKVFTGADDPFAPAEQVAAFETEMENAGADYELVSYPGVVHSFTAKVADRLGEQFNMPLRYDAHADQDSWQKTLSFFDEILR